MSVENIDTYTSQLWKLKISSILYSVNQLVDSNLWNSSVYPISIFGLNKLLNTDTYNILHIRERSLGNKIEKDIPSITSIGYAA